MNTKTLLLASAIGAAACAAWYIKANWPIQKRIARRRLSLNEAKAQTNNRQESIDESRSAA